MSYFFQELKIKKCSLGFSLMFCVLFFRSKNNNFCKKSKCFIAGKLFHYSSEAFCVSRPRDFGFESQRSSCPNQFPTFQNLQLICYPKDVGLEKSDSRAPSGC